MSSSASSVAEYLAALPPDRAAVLRGVLDSLQDVLPDGLERGIAYGMIGWSVPLATYPDTYNGKPLMYLALAAQKNYCALYVTAASDCGADRVDENGLRQRWAGGKPLDMGRSCIRFQTPGDLDLALLRELVGQWTVAEFVNFARAQRERRGKRQPG